MAFRAFDERQHDVAAEPPRVGESAVTTAQLFTPAELGAIALARIDAPQTVRAPGRLATLWRRLFGLARPNPLANPRLEALRRFAIIVRTSRGAIAPAELDSFFRAGFTPRAAQTLTSYLR